MLSKPVDGPAHCVASRGSQAASQSSIFHHSLNSPKRLVRLGPAQGASGHCGGLAASAVEATIFDWIEDQLRH